jgi:hypothetical protein
VLAVAVLCHVCLLCTSTELSVNPPFTLHGHPSRSYSSCSAIHTITSCIQQFTFPTSQTDHTVHTKFHKDWYRHSRNTDAFSLKCERLWCWYYLWEGYKMYTIQMPSCGMIFLPSFMKIGTGIQAILMFCLSNLCGPNDGVTYGRGSGRMPLRWLNVAWHSYQVSWRLVEAFKQY